MPTNRLALFRGAVVLGVMAVVGAGVVLGQRIIPRTEPSPSPSAKPDVKGFKTFQDRVTGLRISYPQSWTRYEPKDPPREVPLVAGPGGEDYLLVRVCQLPQPIDPKAVPALRDGFDAIIKKGNPNIIEQRQITVNGVPGFYYVYAFADEKLKQTGVHAHYFLVDGATIMQMILQALPSTDFQKLATTFDKVANSFHAVKRTGPLSACGQEVPGQG